MKLLITGFEPFGAVKVSPSWEVAKHIALSPPNGVVVCAKLLPVSFERAGSVLLEAVNQFAPDVVIILGVATQRAVISYERVAINIDESSKADNDGKLCSGTPIRLNGPTAFFSNLPIKEMREATILAGIAAEFGGYIRLQSHYVRVSVSYRSEWVEHKSRICLSATVSSKRTYGIG